MLPSSLTIGGDLTQESGAFELGGGVLNLADNFLLGESATLAGTGNVNFIDDLERGMIPGALVWDGDVAPGAITGDVTGRLDIDGTVELSETASFTVQLGGLDAGMTHDQLAITGAADFNGPEGLGAGANLGALNVALSGGFIPGLGDEFVVMLFSERDGQFEEYFFPALPGGLQMEAVWSADQLTLIVTPSPAPVGLGVLALSLVTRRRRAR
jgi:hypothetical protein